MELRGVNEMTFENVSAQCWAIDLSIHVLNGGILWDSEPKKHRGDRMLKTDLRKIKRQNIQDLLNAWIEGVKEKEESRMTHKTRTAFLQMPNAPWHQKQIFHQYWWITGTPVRIWLSTKNICVLNFYCIITEATVTEKVTVTYLLHLASSSVKSGW